MPVTTSALRTEITTDPRGYGYAPFVGSGNDQAVADLLNTVRDGTNPPANPTAAGGTANGATAVNKGTITTQELVEAIVQSEMPTNASQRDWLIMVATGDRVRVDTASTARAGLLAIFGAATTTRANLTTVSSRNGSRAEELFGTGVIVTRDDVASAR